MMLSELEAKELLAGYGIPVNEGRAACSAIEASEAARHIGFPAVVKVLSEKIVHKSDLGLVALNLCNPSDVGRNAERILAKAHTIDPDAKVVVESMAPQGTEVIVGARRDPQFGPTILFGLGGIFVEVFKDVSIRVAPVDRAMAMDMIDDVKGYAILKGARGKKGVDIEALADIIVNTSKLMMEQDRVMELDMNPVMAYENGAMAVDARALVRD
ncbi:acetyl-CoA synthetase beta subunit [Methanocella paludicola SANAE]|uniref:acetate--CoA ligase (ADP-forming) n=1 Tax=Methanocella paludicola (strain DSM 17711 / JCM 13418 / NBRC 101707 / SANAE) TaxID=304371 RepID=D1YVP8_METPS|nr:acetate--CoA ligase family protein [Methanocella paludicola]BAI60520.1 acetyl-CoA synthetase beta subunit [Methanocella paludicola SANAE]